MLNLPNDLLPRRGLYSLAFYGADQRLAFEPNVSISIDMPTSRAVRFSEGTAWLYKELRTR